MKLLERFVPVRIVNLKGVDLDLFRFDYDLTFAVLMMDASGRTYARFGAFDAGSRSERMSIAGLKRAMGEVLALHQEGGGAPAEAPPAGKPATLEDLPSFKRSKAAKEYCFHCHYVYNYRFRELREEGRFREEMLFLHPLPENLGISLDVDWNRRVKSVLPASPAARAGVREGDLVVRAGSTRVFTSADLQFALDAVPDPGGVALVLERGGQTLEPLTLDLPRGWRKGDISWRASQDDLAPTVGFWGKRLEPAERRRRGLAEGQLALQVTFLFPGEGWDRTRGGLRMHDVILGWNGARLPDLDVRQFHSRFRLEFEVGGEVTLNVLRGEAKLDLVVRCLEVKEE